MIFKMGLRGKSILLIGSLLLAALIMMGGAIYFQALNLAISELLESAGKSIGKDAIEIEGFVRRSRDDLMVVADTPPIQGIIRARENQGTDPLTGDKAEYWFTRLEQIFGAFLTNHPEIYQLRYLDVKGDEIVRTTRTGKVIWNTPRPELRNMAEYPCFSETIRLKPNEVYYSTVAPNREPGATEVPRAPLFRIATPIFDATSAVRGVVVINLFADALFSPVRTAPPGTKKFLVDEKGIFLVHPDRTREFGLDTGFVYDLRDAAPGIAKVSDLPDQMVKYHKTNHHVDGYQKIQYDPAAASRYWAVLYEIPESVAMGKIYPARSMMLFVGFFIATVSLALITWVVTRKMVTPILRLSKAVKKIEGGDLAARVPDDDLADEIGELAVSINRMAGTVEKNINELRILNRITVAVASSFSVDKMSANALDAILELQLLKFEKKAAIFVADESARTLRLVASRGFSEQQKALDAVVPFGDCLCGRAAETGEPIVSERCCDNPQHTRKYAGMAPHGHLILPLKSGDTVLGVLVLYLAADTTVSSEESRLYLSVADILAVALQNAINYADIERLKHQHGLILDCAGDGIYGVDLLGNCTFINTAAEKLLGWEWGEISGKHVHSLVHYQRPDGTPFPATDCPIYAAAADGLTRIVSDDMFWRKDGTGFPVEYTSTPVVEAGRILGAVVVFRDITERKRAEQRLIAAKAFSDDLINSVPGILFCFTPDGRFLRWSSTLETGLEYARDAVERMQPLEIVAPEDRARAEESIRETFKLGKAETELTLLTGGGRRIPYQILGHAIQVDGLPALLGVGIDITVRRKMDAVIKEYSRGLEEKVAERTKQIEDINVELQATNRELEQRRAEAESATRAKSDFLANMSHELRTPLNSILGFSEIMRDGLAGEVNVQQREYLTDVWESGSHLLRLINDILDISKIEAGKMELELEEVDLTALLDETLVFFREKAARHSISLHAEVADDVATIIADERKIKQVLINLLTNALKFTPDGGEVGVCTNREGDEVQVSVWDTGIGIAPEDLGRLFQPFQQLESALTKKYQGTGLGLSLSRKIVELHGGRIWVESTPGQGSRFTFAIPLGSGTGGLP